MRGNYDSIINIQYHNGQPLEQTQASVIVIKEFYRRLPACDCRDGSRDTAVLRSFDHKIYSS